MRRKALYNIIVILFVVLTVSSSGFSEEPQSEEANQVKALVEEAATIVESKGKDAFPEFEKKDSKWLKGETYIFVADMTGIVLFHPIQPDLKGKNLNDMKDANGKAFVQEMINTLKTEDSGWVEYRWPKPGETKPSKKLSYIKKVTKRTSVSYEVFEETFIVGAGIYID